MSNSQPKGLNFFLQQSLGQCTRCRDATFCVLPLLMLLKLRTTSCSMTRRKILRLYNVYTELGTAVASDQDTKYLHAEVYYGSSCICNVDTEKGEFNVCFSADPRINPSHESIDVNLDDFVRTLKKAKEELLKFYNGINDPL